jgi:hypothetical protein
VAVIDHEEVLADPVPQLEGVARGLGLSWTEGASAWVVASDRPGEGYELARVADEQRGRWRTRLAPDELRGGRRASWIASIARGRWPLT